MIDDMKRRRDLYKKALTDPAYADVFIGEADELLDELEARTKSELAARAESKAHSASAAELTRSISLMRDDLTKLRAFVRAYDSRFEGSEKGASKRICEARAALGEV